MWSTFHCKYCQPGIHKKLFVLKRCGFGLFLLFLLLLYVHGGADKKWITPGEKGLAATCFMGASVKISAFIPSSKRITFMEIYKTFYFNELGCGDGKGMTNKEFLSWNCQEWFRLSCFIFSLYFFPTNKVLCSCRWKNPRLTSFVQIVSLKHVHGYGRFCGSLCAESFALRFRVTLVWTISFCFKSNRIAKPQSSS